jgi:hypothetical protein
MSNTNTGGPAFPRPFSVDDADPDISYPAHVGLSLRDYFAAKAMQGSLADDARLRDKVAFAKWCYEMADAMLSARGTEKAREQ